MSAGKYDFSIEQGSSFTLSLVYKDSNGNPVDLTGWCARLVWKSNAGVETFSTETVNPVYRFDIDEPNGKLILQFPASVTNEFNFSTAKYDLELQSDDDLYNGGGKYTTRILYGTITLIKRFSQTSTVLECNL
ncbi:MAG: hypothetical protein ACKO7N_05200 [Candidatus Nitrosotenuis sp.]